MDAACVLAPAAAACARCTLWAVRPSSSRGARRASGAPSPGGMRSSGLPLAYHAFGVHTAVLRPDTSASGNGGQQGPVQGAQPASQVRGGAQNAPR